MITQLTGTIVDKEALSLTLEVSGVGYGVMVSGRTANELVLNQAVTLFIAENIKEDHYELYGFSTKTERSMYNRLTNVSGVGPKAAMAILSSHNVSEIEAAIAAGSATVFSSVAGIGAKTASRIILELKGKLDVSSPAQLKADPAYQALIALGYNPRDAVIGLEESDASLSLDERVKTALQRLAK